MGLFWGVDSDIQKAILADKSALEIKKMAVEKGMKTLLDSAMSKVSEGSFRADHRTTKASKSDNALLKKVF